MVELVDTRRSERRAALAALGVRISPWSLTHCRRGRCPTDSHEIGVPGSIPGPATCCGWASAPPGLISLDGRVRPPDPPLATGYANWHSGEVESLVPVGSSPTPVTEDPVVQGQRRLGDNQESDGSTPSGITDWSVGVPAARLLGREEDRVQFPNGPLIDKEWATGPKGRHLVCTQEIGVRVPGGPLE